MASAVDTVGAVQPLAEAGREQKKKWKGCLIRSSARQDRGSPGSRQAAGGVLESGFEGPERAWPDGVETMTIVVMREQSAVCPTDLDSFKVRSGINQYCWCSAMPSVLVWAIPGS